jgi:hypothetical protein
VSAIKQKTEILGMEQTRLFFASASLLIRFGFGNATIIIHPEKTRLLGAGVVHEEGAVKASSSRPLLTLRKVKTSPLWLKSEKQINLQTKKNKFHTLFLRFF